MIATTFDIAMCTSVVNSGIDITPVIDTCHNHTATNGRTVTLDEWQHQNGQLQTVVEDPMPALPSSNPAQFVQGAPVLHVQDVKAAATFYRDVLGFTWDFGDEGYAVVWRDNSAIHFVRDDRGPSGVHLFQWIKDVDAYHKELVAKGAEIASGPTDQPYGIRELAIRDVNGVGVVFGQDIEHD
jgi:uncharacterized glyoxalase superfamily protein PhnB